LSESETQFEVLEGYPTTAEGEVHIDKNSMNLLGILPQEFIEIQGKKKTLAKCLPLYLSDKGKNGIIRVDGTVRENADIAIGDTVTIRRIIVVDAEKVVVSPLGDIPAIDMDYLSHFQNRPLVKGDNVTISSNTAARGIIFQVIELIPEADACSATSNTIFLSTRKEDNIGTANRLVNDGVQHFHEEEYVKALECYDKAIEFYPENVEAWNWKGDLHLKNNQLNDTLECCNKVLDIDPRNIDALKGKGNVLRHLQKLEDSISTYNSALEIDPTNIDCLMGKGMVLEEINMLEEAISCYDKVIQNKEEAIRGWIYKGGALIKCDKIAEAMQCYQESLKIGTYNAHSLFGIALVKSLQGKFDDALTNLDEAISLEPSLKQAANHELSFKDLRHDERFGVLVAEEIYWKDVVNQDNVGLLPSFYKERHEVKAKPATSFSKMKNKIFGDNDENSNIFFALEAYSRDASSKVVRIDIKKNTCQTGDIVEIIRIPIFDWDEIPGNDTLWLSSFLKNHLMIDWTENSTMTKINDGNSILITSGEKNIRIDLDKKSSKATMLVYNDTYSKYTFSVPESVPLYVYPDKYKTVVKCLPIYPSDEGKGIIRMNNLIRHNTCSSIGEFILINKLDEVKTAEKVVVTPLQKIPPIDERYLADSLNGEPIIKGDYVSISYFGGSLSFEVIGVTPLADAVLVTEKTIFHIEESVS
jgi:tetratricopeptide (TPR) repeat protein